MTAECVYVSCESIFANAQIILSDEPERHACFVEERDRCQKRLALKQVIAEVSITMCELEVFVAFGSSHGQRVQSVRHAVWHLAAESRVEDHGRALRWECTELHRWIRILLHHLQTWSKSILRKAEARRWAVSKTWVKGVWCWRQRGLH